MIHEIFCVLCFKLFQNIFVEDDGDNENIVRNGRDLRGDWSRSSHFMDEQPQALSVMTTVHTLRPCRAGDPPTLLAHTAPSFFFFF